MKRKRRKPKYRKGDRVRMRERPEKTGTVASQNRPYENYAVRWDDGSRDWVWASDLEREEA